MHKLTFKLEAAPCGGWQLQGTKKTARTRGGHPLVLPSRQLAEVIARQLQEQGAKSPLFLMASAVIDLFMPQMDAHRAEVLRFLDTDLTCYRTPDPQDLRACQDARWDPVLKWADASGMAGLSVTEALGVIAQPAEAHKALQKMVTALDAWHLMLAHRVTHQVGSVLVGMMFAQGHFNAEDVYQAAFVEEIYQTQRYGEEAELSKKLAINQAVLRELEAFRTFLI